MVRIVRNRDIMAEYLSPGVYVEEFDSGEVPMESVGTSTAGFIGVSERGPATGSPVLITSFAEYRRNFGGYLSENDFGDYRYLAYAVSQFFTNGGARCYIKRVVPSDAEFARNSDDETLPLILYAKDPGSWANKVTVYITLASRNKTQIIAAVDGSEGSKYKVKSPAGFLIGDIIMLDDGENKVYNKITSIEENIFGFEEPVSQDMIDTNLLPKKLLTSCEIHVEVRYDGTVERYEFATYNINSVDFIGNKLAKSDIVLAEVNIPTDIISPFELISGKTEGDYLITLSGGRAGTKEALSSADYIGEDKGPGNRTGIQAFIDNSMVSIMAIPGVTDPNVSLSLIAHCENLASRFAILDIPRDKRTVNDVLEYRNFFDSQYAALYHPWVKVFDPLVKNAVAIPPSGSVAGIYARSDIARGVFKAPANEVVSACVGLDCPYTTGEQDILNPKGVNLIRSFPGQGIRVWGARTCSSNALWRYVNVRRLFIFIEETIKASTNWVVFEPNDQTLWLRVQRTISVFLTTQWRIGALAGAAESEAFFVDVGPNTMTKDDIDNGRLICIIGIAPVKPAEFVIFRITQKTSE